MKQLPKRLNIRTALACSNLWKIDPAEKDQLNRFFILFDNGEQFFKDVEKRNDPQFPYQSEYFLRLEGDNTTWNVRFLKPISYLKRLGEQKIALSFREHRTSNFAWVLVTEWKDKQAQEEINKAEEAPNDA